MMWGHREGPMAAQGCGFPSRIGCKKPTQARCPMPAVPTLWWHFCVGPPRKAGLASGEGYIQVLTMSLCGSWQQEGLEGEVERGVGSEPNVRRAQLQTAK